LLALADLRLGRWDSWDTGVDAAGETPEAARIGQALEVAAGVGAELVLDLASRTLGGLAATKAMISAERSLTRR
jgi:hypothetical protein